MTLLNVYRLDKSVNLPEVKTEQSACFDIEFSNFGKRTYTGYTSSNKPFERSLISGLYVGPNERAQVPTGLFFDIPKGFCVKIFSRSSAAYKLGLVLANGVAVIDSDYVDEIFLLVHNITDNGYTINPGQRLAQGELVMSEPVKLMETSEKPTVKTDRIGGIGSTDIEPEDINTAILIQKKKKEIKNE